MDIEAVTSNQTITMNSNVEYKVIRLLSILHYLTYFTAVYYQQSKVLLDAVFVLT